MLAVSWRIEAMRSICWIADCSSSVNCNWRIFTFWRIRKIHLRIQFEDLLSIIRHSLRCLYGQLLALRNFIFDLLQEARQLARFRTVLKLTKLKKMSCKSINSTVFPIKNIPKKFEYITKTHNLTTACCHSRIFTTLRISLISHFFIKFNWSGQSRGGNWETGEKMKNFTVRNEWKWHTFVFDVCTLMMYSNLSLLEHNHYMVNRWYMKIYETDKT